MSSTAAPQTVPQPDVEPADEPIVAAAAAPPAEGAEPEIEAAPSGAPMANAGGVPYTRWQGRAMLLGVWTGDDRIYEDATWRDLPLALKVQTATTPGHDGAQLVGRIDTADIVDASDEIDARTGQPYGDGARAVMMSGVFDSSALATQTAEQIAGGFLKGVSVDLSDVRVIEELADADHNPVSVDALDSGEIDPSSIIMQARIPQSRIMGLTATTFPALEGAYIQLVDGDGNTGPGMEPGQPTREQQASAIRASAAPDARNRRVGPLTAAAAPVEPTAAWFERPDVDRFDRSVNITDEGRVFGLVAPEGVYHIGLAGQRVSVPHSAIDYALFTLGSVKTAEGAIIPTGCITLGTGHADMYAGVAAATEHYDNTGTAVADIAVGEDECGIWFSGALRPDVTPEQIRTLRGSKLSGDWRPWGGSRELVAVLAVNTPGFPVVRQLVASGRPAALVASFGLMAPVSPEIEEVRALLPALNAAARRELVAQETESAGRRERAAGLNARRLSLRRTALQARLATLRSKETR